MGSHSDWETMRHAVDILKNFKVPHEVKAISAHRALGLLQQYVSSAEKQGVEVMIAGAGGAAHLAGVIASHTTLPVIGVPIHTKSLGGMDSLLSTVQMPGGVPVATMAIGETGARNAGIFALEMLGISDKTIGARLRRYKKGLVRSVKEKDNKYRKRGI